MKESLKLRLQLMNAQRNQKNSARIVQLQRRLNSKAKILSMGLLKNHPVN